MFGLIFLTIGGGALALAGGVNLVDCAIDSLEASLDAHGRQVENCVRQEMDAVGAKALEQQAAALLEKMGELEDRTRQETAAAIFAALRKRGEEGQ